MTVLMRASAGTIAAIVLSGCTSIADDIKRKCAPAPDPTACQKAQYEQMRADDDALLDANDVRYSATY